MKYIFNITIAGCLFLSILIACTNSGQSSSGSTEKDTTASVQADKDQQEVLDTMAFIRKNERAGEYWCVSTDSLWDDDLNMMPPSELCLMRNEIFARYGFIFKSEDLKKHFEAEKWYRPLFNNVDRFITPREKHNILLIQKHEKVNKEISKKELFDFFIDKINKGERDQIPKMVSHRFGESAYPNFQGLISAEKQVFNSARKYRFLIYSRFNGCDDCPTEFRLIQFDTDGNYIDHWDLGNNLQIEMTDGNRLHCYAIEYPNPLAGDDTLSPVEKADTTQFNILLDENEELVFE